MVETLQLDESWTGMGSLWGPHLLEFSSLSSLALDETLYLVLGHVEPLSFVMNMLEVLCTSYPKSSYSLDIYICGILLNWIYLFN